MQLGVDKVKETLCIGAFGARVLIKELILDRTRSRDRAIFRVRVKARARGE